MTQSSGGPGRPPEEGGEPALRDPDPSDTPGSNEAAGGADSLVLRRTVTIRNQRGLHARAAAKFVAQAERYGAVVTVVRDGQSVAGRSIMGLMMLGAGPGAILTLEAEGWDAREALDALAALIEAGFDEV